MLEKGKISASQMGMITYTTLIATGALLPAITAKVAERDMWLSPIWASLTGFLILSIIYPLSRLYPLMVVSRYVNIANFLENVEAIVMAIWVLGVFGIWASPNMQEMSNFIETIIPFLESSIFTFIPTVLLFITIIQKKWKKKSYNI